MKRKVLVSFLPGNSGGGGGSGSGGGGGGGAERASESIDALLNELG